jgi:hypothetical protein
MWLPKGAVLASLLLTQAFAADTIPHLEKRGQATQLIVDGKPFLVLGGELHNTASSSAEYMAPVWPVLHSKMHLNTVLAGLGWDWIEPEEGKFDFQLVDTNIDNARRNNLHLIWLWFGSWKNALSSFAPAWVKAAQDRFPRAQIRDGKTVEILSTLSDANRSADARAFAALMRHIREYDKAHTVLMVQIENEVGVLGDSRDRSAAANAAFAQPVPQALMDYLQSHKDALLPEFRQVWQSTNYKTSGAWEQVFGTGPQADEIFMAWNYSRYIDSIAQAGKKEYPLPMFVNAWLVQPEDRTPGDYPSGGPQDHMHDIWRAGAPALDMLCPDIYLPGFAHIAERYSRSGNPLFIPESFDGAPGAANAFYAAGQQRAIGYSPFGFEAPRTGLGEPGSAPPPNAESLPLSVAYATLSQLAPLILEHQAEGTIAAVQLDRLHPEQSIQLGGYILNVSLTRNVRTPDVVPDLAGYGLFFPMGPDEFLLAGNNLQVTFTPGSPVPPIAGIARQEAGRFEDGKWIVTRRLGGDDSVLRYDISTVAGMNQSGSGVRLSSGERGIQRVRLYRYH